MLPLQGVNGRTSPVDSPYSSQTGGVLESTGAQSVVDLVFTRFTKLSPGDQSLQHRPPGKYRQGLTVSLVSDFQQLLLSILTIANFNELC